MSLLFFDLPELTLEQLDSCTLRLDALESWLGELPFAHPSICSQKLNGLLTEFNQLKFIPLRRLEWLNLLQPAVNKVMQGLDRGSHLQQEGDQAQALQQHLAQGYKRVINDLLKLREQLLPHLLARSLLQALFAALENSSALILRSCLLSVNAPQTSWQELNLLYNLACQSRLQHKNLKETAPLNCEQVYFQALLLGLIQAESLRRDEINQVYPLLAEWSRLINRLAYNHPHRLFVITAENNYAPKRATLNTEEKNKPQLSNGAKYRGLALDTRMLAETLQETLAKSNLSKRLIQHLATCLGEVSTRITPRITTNEPITLVLGLRSVHFHMNNQRTLDTLIAGSNVAKGAIKSNPFLNNTNLQDPWAAAFDTGENNSSGNIQLIEMESNLSTSLEEELSKRHPVHQLVQINASATGYCLFWLGEAADQLKTGELVAFKEKASEPWQAGLIRWVREAAEGQQLGVERLGGRMQPCAVKPIIKVGEPRDYMPGFLIPELPVLGVSAGLITPLLPFREGQKVEISYSQGVEKARLVELISSPGEFNHFRLESLGQKGLSLH
ncbi:MAG: hypothetical protein GX029_11695 [Pseudomonadaceae bacterium]|nr:hypothetical protein [Pseudomonadaceae bacterium]